MGALLSVRTALKSMVDALITGATTDIVAAYDYQPTKGGKTPIVVVEFESIGEEPVDSINNSVAVEFILRPIVERTSDYSTQIGKLLGITDDLLDEIRKDDNWTLSGTSYYTISVDVSKILGSKMGDLEVLYQEIKVEAKVLKSTV